MRNRKLQLTTLFLLAIGLGSLHAQSVFVNKYNGEPEGYALNKIQKMCFANGKLTVKETNNNINEYMLSDVSKLTFTVETLGIEDENHMAHLLSLHPNPVSNTLTINLANVEDGQINIFNTEGKLMMSQEVSSQSTVKLDVTHLPKGVYFCRYGNNTKVETIKLIKQ